MSSSRLKIESYPVDFGKYSFVWDSKNWNLLVRQITCLIRMVTGIHLCFILEFLTTFFLLKKQAEWSITWKDRTFLCWSWVTYAMQIVLPHMLYMGWCTEILFVQIISIYLLEQICNFLIRFCNSYINFLPLSELYIYCW